MSETVIKAENLAKKYIIGHKGVKGYMTFREQILQYMHGFYSGTKRMISGQQPLEGDVMEEFWALKDINFEIKQGTRLGIIGRNGAGKSTLLKILSRITEPTTGKIFIKGRVASLLEVGTGFHHELTGRENIFLNGAILGMSRLEIKRKFDEIVDFSGVEKFLDTPVKRYSSGMYVRLAFAIAAHLEPEILIVDEVLAVGDTVFQKKCLGKMDDISSKDGRTILFVSHDLHAIEQLCDTIIYLKEGMISEIGKKNEVLSKYIRDTRSHDGIVNLNLSAGVFLEGIKLHPQDIDKGSDLHFEIRINYNVKPNISDLCLLIYNSDNIRVGIIDLRNYLDKVVYEKSSCIYRGYIKNLNLVEGEYYVGIHYGIDKKYNDIYDICLLRIKPEQFGDTIRKYEAKYRGLVEIEHQPEK